MQYPQDSDKIFNRLQESGFDALTPTEQVFVCIDQLEQEVNNGGFHQFFWNSAGNHTPETLAALEQIGAQATKTLLMEAIAIAFDNQAMPRDRTERQQLLDHVLGEDADTPGEALSALDRAFCDQSDPLDRLLNDWLASQD